MRPWTVLPLLFLVSCSLQAKLVLQPSGGADVSAAFHLEAPARDAWASLRDVDPTLPPDPFDPALLKASLGAKATVSRSGTTTTVGLPVADLHQYVPTARLDDDHWEGTLDREGVRRWASLTSWAGSPALDAILPAPGVAVTEGDYRDLLAYLLGPGITDVQAKAWIDGSTVQLTVVAPKAIKSAPGSASVSDRTAVYRWPLVRVLTLVEPIRLRLNF